MGKDSDGIVTLEELCMPRAMALVQLQTWAQHDPGLGSCAAVWECPEATVASREMTGTWFSEKKMLFSTFAETLKKLGWPGLRHAETRKLVFTSLDLHGCGVICREDLEWLDKWR